MAEAACEDSRARQPAHPAGRRTLVRWWPHAAVLVLAAALLALSRLPAWREALADPRLQTFAIYFLSILLEALPFVLVGALISGAVEVFVPQDLLPRLAGRLGWAGVPATAVLSAVLPICECGVVAVGRGLLRKGLPLAHTVTYLLAAPIFNPVVLASTLVAFGFRWEYGLVRAAGGLAVPVAVGLLVAALGSRWALRPEFAAEVERACQLGRAARAEGRRRSLAGALRGVLGHARGDLLGMVPYLMFGVGCAAGLKTLVGSRFLEAVGQSDLLGSAAAMGAAVSLSLCSEADAFVAASFKVFSFTALMSFLVLGPMLDVKLMLMYRAMFRKRFIAVLALAVVAAVSIYVALVWGVIRP